MAWPLGYFWMDPVAAFAIARVGDSLGLLIFIVMGITISGQNEAWRRAAAATGRSEERLRVTLGSIGDGVITTDQGRVSQLNAVAQGLTGWTEIEAAGQPPEDVLVIVNEQFRRPVENLAHKVLREGGVVGLANHTVLLSKDGREIPADDSAAPIRAADGTMTGVVVVFRDATERRREEGERTVLLKAERDARMEAEAADQRLRFALQAGRMGTWQWTVRTGTIACPLPSLYAFPTSGGSETLIEGDERRLLPKLRPQKQATGELNRLAGTKRVALQQRLRSGDNLWCQLDDQHGGHVRGEGGTGAITLLIRERPLPRATHQRGRDLHRRQPTRRRHIRREQASDLHAALVTDVSLY